MKAIALFGAASLLVIAITGAVFTIAYESPAATRAVWTSAAVAFLVQLVAFAIVKRSIRTNVMAGWGIGAMLRFLVLGIYAVVVVEALGLQQGAALVSLVAFFFLSTLIEPLLLKS